MTVSYYVQVRTFQYKKNEKFPMLRHHLPLVPNFIYYIRYIRTYVGQIKVEE